MRNFVKKTGQLDAGNYEAALSTISNQIKLELKMRVELVEATPQ